MKRVPTYCRVCEPACALIAEVDDDRIRLLPDDDHPVHKGFACHKGLNFTEIHDDPDRLNFPRKRTTAKTQAGEFEDVAWDQALDEIGAQLLAVRDRHGAEAISYYFGNPSGFNSTGRNAARQFSRAMGARYAFGSGTQDCANKFAGAEAIYGTVNLHPIPDFQHTDYFLDIGSNPRISHMSFVHMTNPVGALREIVARGGKVRHVNPRRTESVTPATGELIQIKPDTDLYLLAAMINEIREQGWVDDGVLESHAKHVDALFEFVARFPSTRVESVVGIAAAEIKTLAREFATAPSASVHMSTGVNMGQQGTLAYWLVQMLSLVTGNLGARGGNIYSPGYFPAATVGKRRQDDPFFATPFGPLRTVAGSLPANLLVEHIESGLVKALIVLSGNPILSVAGEERTRKAFEQLELLVVIDIYPNATAQIADYALPATDWLERADINSISLGFQPEPYVQYVDAVVSPKFERKEEWWIFASLEQRLGLPSILDQDEVNPLAKADRQLAQSGLSLAELAAAPSRTIVLESAEPALLFELGVQNPDRLIDCCPALFADALARADSIFDALSSEAGDQLKLITLRTNYMVNSWFHNMPSLKREQALDNPLYMHPDDAERLDLENRCEVRVANDYGAVIATIAIDDNLRPGVVAMTHGWGHASSPELQLATNHPGVNVNTLLPSGLGSFEPLSNQAHMTGIPVTVQAAN